MEFYEKGVKIKTVEDLRETPPIKTINYTMAVKYLTEFYPLGYFEVLYISKNKITKCTSSNIFFIKNKSLITPKENILEGITRKIIINICSPMFDIIQRDINLTELNDFEEAFITSTDKEVLLVISIDNFVFNKEKVGEKTKSILKEFQKYIDSRTWIDF